MSYLRSIITDEEASWDNFIQSLLSVESRISGSVCSTKFVKEKKKPFSIISKLMLLVMLHLIEIIKYTKVMQKYPVALSIYYNKL